MAWIYEVNLEIEKDTADAFLHWLTSKHIAEMCESPGFIKGTVYRVEDTSETHVRMTCAYEVESREALQRYLDVRAAVMRQEGLDLFGGKFTATRRMLEVVGCHVKTSYCTMQCTVYSVVLSFPCW